MLYSLYEAQHMALAPFRFWAELSRGWFGHPFSPFIYWPHAKRLAASSDLFLRVTERYEKPEWDLEGVEIEVAQEKPFCRLIHFKQGAPKAHNVEGVNTPSSSRCLTASGHGAPATLRPVTQKKATTASLMLAA